MFNGFNLLLSLLTFGRGFLAFKILKIIDSRGGSIKLPPRPVLPLQTLSRTKKAI
jgi:hypothetical protein